VATNPDPNLELTTSRGVTRTLDDWSTMFQLCFVVLPARAEAAAFIPVAEKIFATFGDSDATCAYLVTGPAEVARRLLGQAERDEITFIDPDHALVTSLGLTRLPAFVHLRQDTSVVAAAEGWDPTEWHQVAREVAKILGWSTPGLTGRNLPPRSEGWPLATV
jgi:hypothetical protein